MTTITINIPDDLLASLDRWKKATGSTREQAVWIALRIMIHGEPRPPVPLTPLKPIAAGGD